MKNMKCYNAGKVGGLNKSVYVKNFNEANDLITKIGYKPISPLNNGLKDDANYWLHMIVDLWMLSQCKVVFFQKNWRNSRGARIEHRFAKLLFKKKIYQEDRSLRKFKEREPFQVGEKWFVWRNVNSCTNNHIDGVCASCEFKKTPQCLSHPNVCYLENGVSVYVVKLK